MGNVFSSASTGGREADVTSESETMSDINISHNVQNQDNIEEQFEDSSNENEARVKAKEEDMIEFKKQLDIKRDQRKEILARHRNEKIKLEKSFQEERASRLQLYENNKQLRELLANNNIAIPENLQAEPENSVITDVLTQMKEELEELKSNNNKLRRDLANLNAALQNSNSDIADLNEQHNEYIRQISALKEVIAVSKTLINLREQQLNDLKTKLNEIEQTLADRETNLLSVDLRQEYQRQLQNIRTLRGLYEERARLAEVTKQGLARQLEEQRILYQAEVNKCKELTSKVENLEKEVDDLHERITNKNNQISSCQSETNGLKDEMTVVNKLFSQVLLGYKSKQDLDKLVHRLEENHGLLTHMAEKENGSEVSYALPKLLLEIVNEVDENEGNKISDENKRMNKEVKINGDIETQYSSNTTAEEIVQNLPKVWRVLMELLSHQNGPDENFPEKVTTCYKSVETKSGPVLVPSVSQTYIRLKDLIIEKLGLVKDVNQMKQLNSHLETRLQEQERKLCLVTTELGKTWHVVGRLRRHHHQLHTHEKILKYELQQKRKLLNELKEELAYCREKWEQAREKNTQSEKDWRKLRAEFTSRKLKPGSPSFNHSAESGYSDERPSDESSESNDESEYVAEPLIRCKKKNKKDFETIIDSSTDLNLAAEREDPASDMIDVADLPLDTQDCDENQGQEQSGLSNNEKNCIETEDEIGEIHDETCNNESLSKLDATSIEQGTIINDDLVTGTASTSNKLTLIDPAQILKNIQHQNEMLAKKDAKLERLEKNSISLLVKSQAIVKYSDQINNTLDHLLNRPTSSNRHQNNNVNGMTAQSSGLNSDTQNGSSNVQFSETEPENKYYSETYNKDTSNQFSPKQDIIESGSIAVQQTENLHKILPKSEYVSTACSNVLATEPSSSSAETLQAPILESRAVSGNDNEEEQFQVPNENVQKQDNSNTDIEIFENLDNQNDTSYETAKDDTNSISSRDGSEPSTSSELDHEARFAARDLRLKRLEEQTKSLVNRVNKTTSKGVKIHYKLEELHNIYGSESSRAGTPSEDTEENEAPDE